MHDDTFEIRLRDIARDWLERHAIRARELTVLSGDVSPRRYIRIVTSDRSAIVAVYPEEIRPRCRVFLATSRLLSEAGVRVPEVLISDCDLGLMLLEDAGTRTLYDYRGGDPQMLAAYFRRAAADIERIQSIGVAEVASLNPALNGELLRRELAQTKRLVIDPLSTSGAQSLSNEIDALFDSICRKLDAEPLVPCHRDFMARNLIPLQPTLDIAVIDHQDLRLGPGQYDLASLLNDSLFPDAELEEEILTRLIGARDDDRVRYHRAAAQRTLKATGTYLMFAERGFDRHRVLIPETLTRALEHLAWLPEASRIHHRLADVLRPLLD